jgi:hypothetical protein
MQASLRTVARETGGTAILGREDLDVAVQRFAKP